MNEAITAIYDAGGRSMRPFPGRTAACEVREDRPLYIPEVPAPEHGEAPPEAKVAAFDHAKHLRRAEALLDETLNLVGVFRASLGDEGDTRAMQAEAMLDVIEKKLDKARSRLDRHDTRHRDLFLAYCERL